MVPLYKTRSSQRYDFNVSDVVWFVCVRFYDASL